MMIHGTSIIPLVLLICFSVICNNLVHANNGIISSSADDESTIRRFHKTRRHRLQALLGECQYDCVTDSDCTKGLLCAANHRAELRKLNVDPRKAYCSAAGAGKYDDVCYNPKKLPKKPLLLECQTECTLDKQCKKGLQCSARHQNQLKNRDVNIISAYCMNGAVNGTCYNAKKLPTVNTEPQCPNPLPTFGGNSTCNVTAAPNCVAGPKFCCRNRVDVLPTNSTKTICEDNVQCFYIAGCNCDPTYGWACYMASLLPNCVPPYQCSN